MDSHLIMFSFKTDPVCLCTAGKGLCILFVLPVFVCINAATFGNTGVTLKVEVNN